MLPSYRRQPKHRSRPGHCLKAEALGTTEIFKRLDTERGPVYALAQRARRFSLDKPKSAR